MNLPAEILRVLMAGTPRRRYGEVWGAVARNVGREISEHDFGAAVEKLYAEGRIRTNRAGGVKRLSLVETPNTESDPNLEDGPAEEPPPAEAKLMPALKAWLEQEFVRNLGGRTQVAIKDTSRGGNRSGVWTRPDFTLAAVRHYNYSTLREAELYGFELKRAVAGNVVGVYEALAHTRYVHFSYLVWHVPERTSVQADLDAILGECARHGVGLIVFSDPGRVETWTIEVDSQKHAPDPDNVDSYIDDRLDPEQQSILKKWLAA